MYNIFKSEINLQNCWWCSYLFIVQTEQLTILKCFKNIYNVKKERLMVKMH